MILYYAFKGERHVMSHDEVEAILRSGAPQSHRDYAATAGEWNDGSWAALDHLHGRPGAVEDGARPTHAGDGSWVRRSSAMLGDSARARRKAEVGGEGDAVDGG